MKIALFSDSYYPYLSGVVRSIELGRRELEKLGHQVYLFAPGYRDIPPEPDVFRFRSLPASSNNGFSLALPIAPRLPEFLRELGVQVVHVHSPFLLGRLGASAARRLQVPLVFTYHTLYDQYVHYVPLPAAVTRPVVTGWVRSFCNGCDLVITPTEVVRQRIEAQGIRAKVKAIPTGVDMDEFLHVDRSWLRRQLGGVAPAEKIILSVARLAREKNLPFLLRAFRLVHRQYRNCRLVIVGTGSGGWLEKLAGSLGIGDRVTVVARRLPRAELANYYAGSDLFLYASVTETQGLIINEAQAAGLPVVAVGAFGVGEMVHDGVDGWLAPAREEALAARAVALLEDDARRASMGEKARQAAAALAAPVTARALSRAYWELIGEQGDVTGDRWQVEGDR